MTDETLEALERHIAHQQCQIDELSEVVARQDAEIEKLTRTVELLTHQVREHSRALTRLDLPDDERPPHY